MSVALEGVGSVAAWGVGMERLSALLQTLRVARLEWLRLRRSRALGVAVGVTVVLTVCAVLLGALRYAAEAQVRERFQERVRREWIEQPDRHPHRVAHFGSYAFRPLGALALFDPGVDSHVGRYVFLEAHRRNAAAFSDASQAGGVLRFGELAPAFVLQIVVPLLLLCLGFGAVASERERGTWTLTLAQGVSPRVVLAGKALGLCAAGAVLVGVAGVVTLAGGMTGPPLDAELPRRIALLALSYLVYVGWVSAAVVGVSFAAPRAQTALVAGLALWIAGCVVFPRAAAFGAGALLRAPTRAELGARIEAGLREVADPHDPSDAFFEALRRDLLEKHGVRDVSELPVNFGGVAMREAERLTSTVHAEHHERLFATYAQQSQLALWLALGDPLLALRGISAALAGTDVVQMGEFSRQAEAHRYAFIQSLNQMHAQDIAWQNDRAQRLERARWAAFPPFEYALPSLAALAPALYAPVAALLFWVAIMVAAVAWLPNRWEARR